MASDDPDWYKDALIYQVHVKSFFDSNDDGVGDFAGLTRKLDYIKDLNVSAIWLLPFYPSPLRDDGYDIADYRRVNPSYGTMREFRAFVRAAHRRGIKVITELVVNHTSDQHEWFQRARRAKPGSRYRDWYVWSDTDQRYQGTRIIFTDTEKSNWAWDPAAKAYYWHRFFSHQPDLNYDNPQVFKAMVNNMRFWLDSGVDGLRLDAIPYLIEREGTNNENLPETHEVLKRFRAELDRRYDGRMFLGEANQWPEDVRPYFGDGDQCHMAYHFPLMPRIYMAIAREDRHPITDIMEQTPEIPDNCQWAIFLRNHDELTLEMVTDTERDYLWQTYARDRRARLNLGIRRRLAPLMDNDRRRIELMNSLLMSMPGTPIVYYGDEIGMGDNVFLGDRDGVRTPMQWSPDRNAGFSRADPESLFLPPLMDPVYGYEALNVEAQSRDPSSLLNWMRRLIGVRQARKVFGRGELVFLYPANRRVLAYLRRHDDETVLCVANLARSAQAVELDLADFKGLLPVELMGRSVFPPVRDGRYFLSLPGHGFLWFQLEDPARLPDKYSVEPELPPEFTTLVFRDGWRELFAGRERGRFENKVLPAYLPLQRWYAGKDAALTKASIVWDAEVPRSSSGASSVGWQLLGVEVQTSQDQPAQRYALHLALDWGDEHTRAPQHAARMIAKARKGPRPGILFEAVADEAFVSAIVDLVSRSGDVAVGNAASSLRGAIQFRPTGAFGRTESPQEPTIRALGAEQSNSSALIEDYLIVKLYRRLRDGVHPEIEIGRFLTENTDFANAPDLLGTIELVTDDGARTALGVMHAAIRNQGDGWSFTSDYLERFLDQCLVLPEEEVEEHDDRHADYMSLARQLGTRTGELHVALCPEEVSALDPALRPEAITAGDVGRWIRAARAEARAALDALRAARPRLTDDAKRDADRLLGRRRQVMERVGAGMPPRVEGLKTRLHGDFHLGQVLVVHNDFFITDFEGEPRHELDERRRKHSPLRDVAGMLRSFDYAGWWALDRVTRDHPDRRQALRRHVVAWRDRAVAAFLDGYRETAAGSRRQPVDGDAFDALVELFAVEKVFYEIHYELANRPAWVGLPLSGALDLIGDGGEGDAS